MHLLTAMNHEVQKLLLSLDHLPMARRLLSGTLSRSEYRRFLIQTYHYVLWTARLLSRAAERMRVLEQAPKFADLLARKCQEEHGHEHWALADLRALGETQQVLLETPPCVPVELYIAWNRFVVEGPTPVAFLGTAYALESLSLLRGAVAVENLRVHSSIPRIQQALTFLERHATEDVSHLDLLAEQLGDLRGHHEQELTVESVRMVHRVYVGLLSSIQD